ncbi:MAG TPA: hypothetical protein VLX09_14225 [Stellaceae bacterium]|nr:hypothetical protein [Stellaceae bacterium]
MGVGVGVGAGVGVGVGVGVGLGDGVGVGVGVGPPEVLELLWFVVMPFVVVELLLAAEVMQEAVGQLIVKLRFSKLLKFVMVLAVAPALT